MRKYLPMWLRRIIRSLLLWTGIKRTTKKSKGSLGFSVDFDRGIIVGPSYVRNQGKISFSYLDSGTYGQYINNCRLQAYEHVLQHWHIDRQKVVDVGCSYGSWADNWRRLGFQRLCGIDPNPKAIELASKVFDEVHTAYASDLPSLYPNSPTLAANGVIVHIMENEEVVRFLSSVRAALSPDGYFLYTVLNAHYYTVGAKEENFELSCVRFLETQEALAWEAGLSVVGQVGTFIQPFISDPSVLKEFARVSSQLRGKSVVPFGEVLLVTRPAGSS
ncbi:MAG: class I SAM-dependent methyltransferase [Chloroflexi bacterium]|nr:class I SAM-dependent methyltransferase [Chloroflexota bacterium]